MRNIKNFNSGTYESFDTTKIYYEASGPKDFKKTIIFLHGLGGNLTAWDPQRKHFEKQGYTTIAFDLRGHGLSERPKEREKYRMELFAKDIDFFIKEKNITNFIVVGHCLGGIITLLLVSSFNIKPKAIILISTSYKLPPYAEIIKRSKILDIWSNGLNHLPMYIGKPGHMPVEKYRGTHDLSPKRVLSDIYYTTAQSYLKTYSSLFSFDGNKIIKNINVPALIIHGQKDTFFPVSIALELNKKIKKSKIVLLPNANHIPIINHPKKITNLMDNFLISFMD